MRRAVVSQTGVGASDLVVCDQYINSTQITLATLVAGTVSYNIEYTCDDVFAAGFTPASATWYTHAVLFNQTANNASNFMFPVTACRINIASGTGTVTLTVLQSGAL